MTCAFIQKKWIKYGLKAWLRRIFQKKSPACQDDAFLYSVNRTPLSIKTHKKLPFAMKLGKFQENLAGVSSAGRKPTTFALNRGSRSARKTARTNTRKNWAASLRSATLKPLKNITFSLKMLFLSFNTSAKWVWNCPETPSMSSNTSKSWLVFKFCWKFYKKEGRCFWVKRSSFSRFAKSW